jgi:hypothetical protein
MLLPKILTRLRRYMLKVGHNYFCPPSEQVFGNALNFHVTVVGFQIRTNKLKEEAYNILDRIPSSYVMKDNIPEEICTANDLAHDEINNVTQPSYPNENYHPGITAPVDLITPYYEGI